jgi:hypothetical protein
MAGRNSAQRGESIELTAFFFDADGDYTDPTDLKVSVYPPGSNPGTGAGPGEAWVYEATLSSGGSGPQSSPSRTIEQTATGKFKYNLAIPADSDLGAAFDEWEGTIDTVEIDDVFTFTVVGGGSIGTSVLYQNNVLFIELDETIAATDGATLEQDYLYYLTTTYTPMYSAIRRLRLDLGPLISDIPDDTLNLAIFEASLSTDAFSFQESSTDTFFLHARREYATCMAELMLVDALSGNTSLSSRMSKTLGDLSISRSGPDILKRREQLENCAARWQVVLETGGEVSPDTSLKPVYSVKGATSDDATAVGREWEPMSTVGEGYQKPLANAYVQSTSRRWNRTFRKRN